MAQRLFIFMQLEFPWALGPTDGRYLLRERADGDAEHVLVLQTLPPRGGAGARADGRRSVLARLPGRGGAGAPVAPEPDPPEVTLTRVTVIDPVSLSAEQQARAWLDGLDVEHEVLATVAIVNRMLHMHRLASADPYVHEVSPAQALVIRAGWGEGEQVADGLWLHARELRWKPGGARSARSRRSRASVLRPQERLASMLGGRSRALVCEELALRARLDLDHGRLRHAALELDRALSLAVEELRGEQRQDLALRIAELEQLHAGVAEQARAPATPTGQGPHQETISHALGRLEAALRARTARGVGGG